MSGLSASLRFSPPLYKPAGKNRSTAEAGGRAANGRTVIEDNASWQAECERVAQQLVITAPADGAGATEWRPLLERAVASLAALQAAAPTVQAELDSAGQDLVNRLEELAAGEQTASTQLAGLRAEHKAALAAVAVLQQEQRGRQEYVESLEQDLQFLNKELDERQREVAEQGDSMSDTRPVARLAQACAALREELRQMDVRTGVLQHLLLQTMARGAAAPLPVAAGTAVL